MKVSITKTNLKIKNENTIKTYNFIKFNTKIDLLLQT